MDFYSHCVQLRPPQSSLSSSSLFHSPFPKLLLFRCVLFGRTIWVAFFAVPLQLEHCTAIGPRTGMISFGRSSNSKRKFTLIKTFLFLQFHDDYGAVQWRSSAPAAVGTKVHTRGGDGSALWSYHFKQKTGMWWRKLGNGALKQEFVTYCWRDLILSSSQPWHARFLAGGAATNDPTLNSQQMGDGSGICSSLNRGWIQVALWFHLFNSAYHPPPSPYPTFISIPCVSCWNFRLHYFFAVAAHVSWVCIEGVNKRMKTKKYEISFTNCSQILSWDQHLFNVPGRKCEEGTDRYDCTDI